MSFQLSKSSKDVLNNEKKMLYASKLSDKTIIRILPMQGAIGNFYLPVYKYYNATLNKFYYSYESLELPCPVKKFLDMASNAEDEFFRKKAQEWFGASERQKLEFWINVVIMLDPLNNGDIVIPDTYMEASNPCILSLSSKQIINKLVSWSTHRNSAATFLDSVAGSNITITTSGIGKTKKYDADKDSSPYKMDEKWYSDEKRPKAIEYLAACMRHPAEVMNQLHNMFFGTEIDESLKTLSFNPLEDYEKATSLLQEACDAVKPALFSSNQISQAAAPAKSTRITDMINS